MNIVTGYRSSSGGKVFIDGINIDENPMAAKRKIGYLPEIPPLYPEMTMYIIIRRKQSRFWQRLKEK